MFGDIDGILDIQMTFPGLKSAHFWVVLIF